jgi:3-phenylpropionate/trans-cinnamate dioxygenase ferredoxin reductase component
VAERIVIVGASMTGGTAAGTLREKGFEGEIVLVGAEEFPPYERPPLSKEYLRGEAPFEASLVQKERFYADNRIETRFGVTAEKLDLAAKTVELANGERFTYDKLLLATGCRNRRPPIPGLELEGVYGLRTVVDADRIRAEARAGRRVVVVGMGFIGCEVASSLPRLGLEVTTLDGGKAPLGRVLGEDVGGVIEKLHRGHGVDVRLGQSVQGFEGEGRVAGVRTAEGFIECDFAVVGLGVEPVIDLVRDTEIALENGILVDEFCRTNVEGVFAAGDVANHYHPLFRRHMRVEHWRNAYAHGEAAALNMIGQEKPFDEVPWFWSDQYESRLEYAGFAMEWDELVVRGSLEENFVAFYMKDGRPLAAVGMNRGMDIRKSMRVIASGQAIDPQALRDESIDLRQLASA